MSVRERGYSRAGRKKIRGFTLIETLVVVAIIGMVAALTLPIFSSYLLKVKAGRLLAELDGPKLVVAENWQAGDGLCLGLLVSGIICDSENGVLQNTGASGLNNIVVKLTPTASGGIILWSCVVTPPEAAPKTCLQ